jgi:hypothetical protein
MFDDDAIAILVVYIVNEETLHVLDFMRLFILLFGVNEEGCFDVS